MCAWQQGFENCTHAYEWYPIKADSVQSVCDILPQDCDDYLQICHEANLSVSNPVERSTRTLFRGDTRRFSNDVPVRLPYGFSRILENY